jgi:adenylosuccinate lyase
MTTLNELNVFLQLMEDIEIKRFLWLHFFSEEALIKYRVLVEIEYFMFYVNSLPQLEGVKPSLFDSLRNIYKKLLLKMPLIQRNRKSHQS